MASAAPAATNELLPLDQVERELSRQLTALHDPGEAPVIRARMSNLVIFCNRAEKVQRISEIVPEIVAVHPARVLLLAADGPPDAPDVAASVRVRRHRFGNAHVCTEQIFLHTHEQSIDRLPFAVRTLLIGDLPTNLWWASPLPPPLAGPLLWDLAEYAQQLIFDSLGWVEPHRGVAATAAWLARFERRPEDGRWRVASDLNWRRLKFWRRLLGQSLDPNTARGAVESITEVVVEHGPHAVTQAWEFVAWLASRLDWRVQAARVQPGVEICWQVDTPNGRLRLRIRRLPEGPSEVRRIRIACVLDSKPVTLNCVVEDERRLSAVPEGVPAAPRTLNFHRPSLTELVSRQLSDREPDPVFRESMEVAKVIAQSVL